MEKPFHRFTELFEQLGLPSDPVSIKEFIVRNSPINESVALADAPFWTNSQSDLLRESLTLDADWAEVVDQLNKVMREH